MPFLDTRLHYDYDNADFTFRARNGNRNDDLRSQFGVTVNAYTRWGERTGKPTYYTDHPFLMKALFQQFTRVVGTDEWVSRVFYLLVSLAIAGGFYTILLQSTSSLLGSLAGALTLVSLPLFAVYQTCVKFETDGMAIAVWLFIALMGYLRTGARRWLITYAALAVAAALAHWTSLLFGGVLTIILAVVAWRARDAAARRASVVTAVALTAGLTMLLGLMSYLQGSIGGARVALTSAFARRAADIPAADWWATQWIYLRRNFADLFPWIIPALALALCLLWSVPALARYARQLAEPRSFFMFLAASLTVGLVWILAFRQGSFVHIYWQFWLALPIASLVGVFVARVRSRLLTAAGMAGVAFLIAHLLGAERAAYASVRSDQLGTPTDVAFLRSLQQDKFKRLVFVPISNAALNQWFQGPLFEYYTDRPVTIAVGPGDIDVSDKILVLRYKQREQVLAAVAEWIGQPLANEKCGERICAYDVAAP